MDGHPGRFQSSCPSVIVHYQRIVRAEESLRTLSKSDSSASKGEQNGLSHCQNQAPTFLSVLQPLGQHPLCVHEVLPKEPKFAGGKRGNKIISEHRGIRRCSNGRRGEG